MGARPSQPTLCPRGDGRRYHPSTRTGAQPRIAPARHKHRRAAWPARRPRTAIHAVGVCGSDVHYYQHGRIGNFVVTEPMCSATKRLVRSSKRAAKSRICGSATGCDGAGIADPNSQATRLGIYNLDPAVRFWAAPVHGVLRPTVVHPASFTFKLPNSVSFAEGAMVEPLAIGMHAAVKAQVKLGDLAVVMGAGTIGMVTAIAALAAGCSRVVITDVKQPKLDLAVTLGPITAVNAEREDLNEVVMHMTEGWGADIVFEASGAGRGYCRRVRTPLPRWAGRADRYAGRNGFVRCRGGAGQRGVCRAHLPLCPRLPSGLGIDGQRQD